MAETLALARPADRPAAGGGGRRDALPRLLAYGALGLPLAFAMLPLHVHLPALYGQFRGVELGLLGAVLLVARVGDAVIDPLLGAACDRLGDRRRAIVAGLPLLAGGFFLLLRPPADAGAGWLLACLLPTYLGFSLVSIAYQAWGAELGADATARNRFSAGREGMALLGVVAGAALPLMLAPELPEGLARLAALWLPLLALAAAVSLVGSGAPGSVAATAVPWREAWREARAALADPRLRRLLAVFVANGIAAALPATLVLFFVNDVLDAPAAAGPLLVLYFLAGACGLPLWVAAAARVGRVPAWTLALLASVAVFAATPFLGAGDVAAFAVVCALSGLMLGAVLPAALLGDLAQARGGTRAGGYFGWWNLVAKLNLALAAGLALPLLELNGYVPGQASGSAALAWLYGGLPVAFKLLAAALLWRWRHQLGVDRPCAGSN